MTNGVRLDWKTLGAELAAKDDNDQADFFIGFLHELDSFETHMHKEAQMLMVHDRLALKYRQIAKEYLPNFWYEGD